MAAEDIEKKVRKMSSQKPESGKDLQQLQEAQNQIVQINAERQGNLQMARLENNANAANNETMSQAVEMASLGGLGGAAVQQQVQAMNPQTQAVLGKYGLGQPRVQRSSSRNVQVTPQKITINNNTTNTTTNNVAVPAANIGGPVQGRTLAIKQDESQARFKTWISNAFAKQNQQAAVREKEYQRREWSLTRSTNKLMKHLSDLGKSVSERLNPQKLASSVGNQFKTILFLFGTTFLAKNWEKVISIGASIERFFFGEVTSRDKNGKVVSRGDSELGKFLKKLFGGQESETVGEAFRKFWYNPDGKGGHGLLELIFAKFRRWFDEGISEDGKGKSGGGVISQLVTRLKQWFEEGMAAAGKIEPPKDLLSKEPVEAIKDLFGYLTGVLSCLFTGKDGLKSHLMKETDAAADKALRSRDSEWGRSSEEDYHKAISEKNLSWMGLSKYQSLGGVNQGDLAEGWNNGKYSTHLFSNDITSEGKLTGTAGSLFRQTAAINAMVKDENMMHTAAFTKSINNLDEYMKRSDSFGIPFHDTSHLKSFGLNNNDIDYLKRSGKLKKKKFVQVVDLKSEDEIKQEKKHATSSDMESARAALNAGIRQTVKDKSGINSMFRVLGVVGGMLLLAPVTGGSSIAIGLGTLGALATSASLANEVDNIWNSPFVQAGITKAVTNNEYDWVQPFTIRTVPEDQVGNRTVVKNAAEFEKYVLDHSGWQDVKQKMGLLEKDEKGNIVSEVPIDLGNESFRNKVDTIYGSGYYSLTGESELPETRDINSLSAWDKLGDVERLEQEHREYWENFEKIRKKSYDEIAKNNRFYKSMDYISGGIDSAKDYLGLERKYPSLTKDQGEFIRKMREAYSKRFKELGIDEKYIDALVAQDAIESGWGTSDLATKSNNFGGLKNGNKGWQKFNSLEDYINSKVDLLRNENGYYKNAFNGDDIDTMMNRVASVYDPKNNKYAGTWKDVYNSVSRYNPLSTEEIKSLRNQGKYAEADLASSSWEKIEDILRAGGVTDFIAGKTKREAEEAGNSGNNSYHTTENLALDIVPTDGNFERLKQQMLSSPLIQEYFKKRGLGVLDETTDEMLKKTGGTGYHFHIGPDRSSVDTWLAWNKEFNSNNSNEGGVYYADNYVEERKPESNYLSQLVLDEKSYNPEFSMPSFNSSPFLASTSFTTPNSATKVPTIDTPMISAKTIGKEITSSNNDSATISDILKTTNLLNDNIKLLQQGQLAQVQATTSIASGLGNMTITVNSGGDKKIPTAGWTKEPYA